MRCYVAGPMTGIPHFNFPAFDAAAEELRKMGHDVVSPAELDDPRDRAAAMASPDGDSAHYDDGKTWGDFLARDVKLLADEGIEAIVCLPGWQKSKGAKLETFVGKLCGLEIYAYFDKPRVEIVPLHETIVDAAHAPSLPGAVVALDPHKRNAHKPEVLPQGETRVVNETTGGEKGSKPQRFSLL